MATPTRVRALVGAFRSAHPETALNLHFHNTRGTGLANVLTALELGVSDFDASVGGLGGRPRPPGAPGNISPGGARHKGRAIWAAAPGGPAGRLEPPADPPRVTRPTR